MLSPVLAAINALNCVLYLVFECISVRTQSQCFLCYTAPWKLYKKSQIQPHKSYCFWPIHRTRFNWNLVFTTNKIVAKYQKKIKQYWIIHWNVHCDVNCEQYTAKHYWGLVAVTPHQTQAGVQFLIFLLLSSIGFQARFIWVAELRCRSIHTLITCNNM